MDTDVVAVVVYRYDGRSVLFVLLFACLLACLLVCLFVCCCAVVGDVGPWPFGPLVHWPLALLVLWSSWSFVLVVVWSSGPLVIEDIGSKGRWRRATQRQESHRLAHPLAAQETNDFPVGRKTPNLRY